MDSLKHLRTHFVLPAVAAATLGAFADTALAGDGALLGLERSNSSSAQIAYNSERYPVYQKVHRAPEREKADFARLEEKSEADKAMTEEEKQKSHGYHRRAPYGLHMPQ